MTSKTVSDLIEETKDLYNDLGNLDNLTPLPEETKEGYEETLKKLCEAKDSALDYLSKFNLDMELTDEITSRVGELLAVPLADVTSELFNILNNLQGATK